MLRPCCPILCLCLLLLLSNKSFRVLSNTCICPSITNSPNLPKRSSSRQVFLSALFSPIMHHSLPCSCANAMHAALSLIGLPLSQWQTNPTLLRTRCLFVLAQSFRRIVHRPENLQACIQKNILMLSFLPLFWKTRNIEHKQIGSELTIWKCQGETVCRVVDILSK